MDVVQGHGVPVTDSTSRSMIHRLLIANRGEIALRIIRACRELGVRERGGVLRRRRRAPHVAAADTRRAHRPGAGRRELPVDPARSSTRRARRGADAVHPGYGFLSENAAFAARVRGGAGLVFVGPPAAVIARMGSKIAARG